jgi:hypothetical protein
VIICFALRRQQLRLQPSHGGNTGSNPVGDANFYSSLRLITDWRVQKTSNMPPWTYLDSGAEPIVGVPERRRSSRRVFSSRPLGFPQAPEIFRAVRRALTSSSAEGL